MLKDSEIDSFEMVGDKTEHEKSIQMLVKAPRKSISVVEKPPLAVP